MCIGFSSNLPACPWFDSLKCGYHLPDSWHNCIGINNCEIYKEKLTMENKVKVIDGVGQDAEIVVNEKGGKQSKSPMAMHLVDPKFLKNWAEDGKEACEYLDENDTTLIDKDEQLRHSIYAAIEWIAEFMLEGGKSVLTFAIDELETEIAQQVIRIAKVLQIGAERYTANNWRLIPQEEHINHALIHLVAALAGDTQDEHIDHAMCRLMMAYATEQSDNFEYGAYVA